MVRTAQELINRGNNLFIVGMLGVMGLGELTAVTVEGGLKGALDEATIGLIGIGAVAWYLRNRYKRTLVPLAFLAADIVMKIVALIIEDADDRGDDIGIGIVFVILAVAWSIVYYRTKAAASATTAAP
ncbi:MAG: hypothetical protein NVS1B3_09260 [Candidatus Dormibacteraceae bacterium]